MLTNNNHFDCTLNDHVSLTLKLLLTSMLLELELYVTLATFPQLWPFCISLWHCAKWLQADRWSAIQMTKRVEVNKTGAHTLRCWQSRIQRHIQVVWKTSYTTCRDIITRDG